jgi:hypothetical protein
MSLPVSDEEFCNLVSETINMASLLRALGYSHQGATYRKLHVEIKRLGLDTAHWKGQRTLRIDGRQFAEPASLADVLVENSTYTRFSLKRRLVQEGVLVYICAECGISEWRGQRLALHLDHINGNPTDNRLPNLRLLCPNCHSLTETYCGKNKKRIVKFCVCGATIHRRSKNCHVCAQAIKAKQPTVIQWPTPAVLQAMVTNTSLSHVGRQLGVSATAVRKRLRSTPG